MTREQVKPVKDCAPTTQPLFVGPDVEVSLLQEKKVTITNVKG